MLSESCIPCCQLSPSSGTLAISHFSLGLGWIYHFCTFLQKKKKKKSRRIEVLSKSYFTSPFPFQPPPVAVLFFPVKCHRTWLSAGADNPLPEVLGKRRRSQSHHAYSASAVVWRTSLKMEVPSSMKWRQNEGKGFLLWREAETLLSLVQMYDGIAVLNEITVLLLNTQIVKISNTANIFTHLLHSGTWSKVLISF